MDGCGFWVADDWEPHAWVQADKFIVDITADQLGDPPVNVLMQSDRRYRAGANASTTLALTPKGAVAVTRLKALWTARN